ncbi:MAG: hypothetical protein ABR549_14415 [Mycobacteriales bacterium]
MRTTLVRKLGLAAHAGRSVVVGGFAAVSLAVTGAALAVPGSPVSLHSDADATASASPTAEPSEDAASASPTAAAQTAEPSESPRVRPTCPPAVRATASPAALPTATASPRHDQGLHCGQLKPGFRDGKHPGQGNGGLDNSSPRPHPTGKPDNEHRGEHGSKDHGTDSDD